MLGVGEVVRRKGYQEHP